MIWIEETPLLADTRAWIQSNRAMVAVTRARIAWCWRRMNSDFAIAGGAAPPLRETVRALLASGMLPPAGGRVFAGQGAGRRCVVCHEPVTSEEVEYELDGGSPENLVCHLACFKVWRDESLRAREESAADGPGIDRARPA